MNDFQQPMIDSPQPVNDSWWTRLSDLVVAPGRLMEKVAVAPRWWVAGLLVFVIMTAFTWLVTPISGPEQLELMRDSKLMRMMPEETWQQQYEQALDPAPVGRILQAVGSGFTSWIMVLLFGFILGFFARMSGGQGTFKQALGVVSWGSLIPFCLATIASRTPLCAETSDTSFVTSGVRIASVTSTRFRKT